MKNFDDGSSARLRWGRVGRMGKGLSLIEAPSVGARKRGPRWDLAPPELQLGKSSRKTIVSPTFLEGELAGSGLQCRSPPAVLRLSESSVGRATIAVQM